MNLILILAVAVIISMIIAILVIRAYYSRSNRVKRFLNGELGYKSTYPKLVGATVYEITPTGDTLRQAVDFETYTDELKRNSRTPCDRIILAINEEQETFHYLISSNSWGLMDSIRKSYGKWVAEIHDRKGKKVYIEHESSDASGRRDLILKILTITSIYPDRTEYWENVPAANALEQEMRDRARGIQPFPRPF